MKTDIQFVRKGILEGILCICLLTGCTIFSGQSAGKGKQSAPLYLRSENSLSTVPLENIMALESGDGVAILSPRDGEIVPLLHSSHKAYVALPFAERVIRFADAKYRRGLASDGDWPLPVRFSWKAVPGARLYTLLVSESPDFSAAVSFSTHETGIELFNFKIGTAYYWMLSANGKTRGIHSFSTEAVAPRLIRIDGISNVRDLGGRTGLDGHRVRQGMIFRSTQLNGASSFKRVSRAEALKKFPDQVAAFDQMQAEHPKNYLPFCATDCWTVFRYEHPLNNSSLDAFHALTGIPAEFEGVKGQCQTADENGKIEMAPLADMPALLFQEFESPETGYIHAGVGGDWFWRLAVNGKIIQDFFISGNTFNPVDKSNYIIDIPVKKGKNCLTVVLKSGMKGWNWCFGAAPDDNDSMVVAIPGPSFLADSMQEYVANGLNLKTEIDLRNHGESDGLVQSPLGPQATVLHISSGSYQDMAEPRFQEAFANAFRVFLDETNYPVVFHCVAGQDRTGALAFILNALLGVDENELYLDWECTGFWNKGIYFRHDTRLNNLISVFDACQGNSLQERVETYALQCGISRAEIRKFRSIMLE